jgi:nicotinamidase-related amidase
VPVTPRHAGLIERDKAVLVVIDVQDRLAAAMPRRDEVVAAVVRMVRAAGALGIPVLVTQQYPKGLGPTVPEVLDAYEGLPEELQAGIVDKTAFCCEDEEPFRDALAATGKGQVVLAGMETHICVVQTALAMLAEGRRVHVAHDGTCSRREADHERALNRMCAEGATATSVESVMYEALGRAEGSDFKSILAIVKDS